MWVMLIKRIPVQNPPPFISIHWAVEWDSFSHEIRVFERLFNFYAGRTEPFDDIIYDLFRHLSKNNPSYRKDFDVSEITRKNVKSFYEKHRNKIKAYLRTRTLYDKHGEVSNWFGAMKIRFKDDEIRIFPHEYSIISKKNMHIYMNETHELVPSDTASKKFIEQNLTKRQRPIYEASLMDGCTHFQAMLNTMGKPIDDFPDPIGYYVAKPQYLNIFE